MAAAQIAAGGVPAAELQAAVQQAFHPFQQQMLAAQAAAAAQAQAAQAAAAAQAQAAQAAAAAQAQAQAQAQAAVLAGIQNQLAQLLALSVENKELASRAYNAGCRDGAGRPFLPVPGAGGVDAPVGQVPLQNFAQLLALSAWCTHYGVNPVPQTIAERRRQIAFKLGTIPIAGDRV